MLITSTTRGDIIFFGDTACKILSYPIETLNNFPMNPPLQVFPTCLRVDLCFFYIVAVASSCARRCGEGLPHLAHPVCSQAALQPQREQGGAGAGPEVTGVQQ